MGCEIKVNLVSFWPMSEKSICDEVTVCENSRTKLYFALKVQNRALAHMNNA